MKTNLTFNQLRVLSGGLVTGVLLILLLQFTGCEKFLDEKSNATLVIPNKLKDLQALLDYYIFLNQCDASAGEASADNYYYKDADYLALANDEARAMYTWKGSNIFVAGFNDWLSSYRTIMYANTALDGLKNIKETPENSTEYRNIEGQALFIRARAFHFLAITWAQAYDEPTATSLMGIPLRLNSNFNEASTRSTVKETYDRIVSELRESTALLPVTAVYPSRPGKAAAYGMLARVFLSMRKYDDAGKYADSCLQLKSDLLDYNTVKSTVTYPFPVYGTEVIFGGRANMFPLLTTRVDSNLYRSYATDDLRKTLFFQAATDGTAIFRGSYDGLAQPSTGITTDETMLIKAECQARQGLTQEALKTLGDLLVKRFKTGKYVAPVVTTAKQALDLVLTERRKELVFRCVRWSDIKRLNLENAGITLTRKIAGKIYTLPPGDPRFALPIPEDVIQLSGMPQNP